MLRRSAVYVALSENVGHDLVFRHYTNKVVVGKYPDMKTKSPDKTKRTARRKNNMD